MRNALFATLLLVPAAAHADTRDWSPARFDRVESAGSYTVDVMPGPRASVRAEGSAEALRHIEVVVEDGKLTIRPERRWMGVGWHSDGRVHVTVTSPVAMRAGSIAGSGRMTIAQIDPRKFAGDIAGSGDLVLPNAATRELSVSVAGSGNVRAAGHAERVSADVAGSGDILFADLHAADLTGSIAGSGSLTAFATRSATLSIMGSGDARVRGGARCTVSKIGSGHADCGA